MAQATKVDIPVSRINPPSDIIPNKKRLLEDDGISTSPQKYKIAKITDNCILIIDNPKLVDAYINIRFKNQKLENELVKVKSKILELETANREIRHENLNLKNKNDLIKNILG